MGSLVIAIAQCEKVIFLPTLRHFIQAKRQMRAGLKEYPYIFQKCFLNSQSEITIGSRLFGTVPKGLYQIFLQ